MRNRTPVRIIYRDLNKTAVNLRERRMLEWRDVFNTIITALVVTLINQYVFYGNQKTEKFLEYEFEILKQQRPVLNRIMGFTYKYELTHLVFTRQIYYYSNDTSQLVINPKTGKPFENETSAEIDMPSFACDSLNRIRFVNDINYIYEKIDLVDHEVYIAFDKLLLFIDKHPLPEKYDEETFLKSDWRNKDIQNQWLRHIDTLRSITFKKMYYCEDCD
jgi:hypothetical protein